MILGGYWEIEKDICASPKQRVQMIDLEVLKIYTWGICTELNNNNYYKVAQHTEPTIPRKKFAVKN